MLRPLTGHVLLEQKEAPANTKDGLFIPMSARKRPNEGTVVLIGDQVREVSKGEKVLYTSRSGVLFEINEKEYLVIKESELMAVIP